MPEDEPPMLSPATARRWGSDAVFDELAFEGEAEDAARQRLLHDGTIADLKGAAPSLRAAFGYARILGAARPRGLSISLREVMPRVHDVAEGRVAARAVLDEIEARVYARQPGVDAPRAVAPDDDPALPRGTGRRRRGACLRRPGDRGRRTAGRPPTRRRPLRGHLSLPGRAVHRGGRCGDTARVRLGDLPRGARRDARTGRAALGDRGGDCGSGAGDHATPLMRTHGAPRSLFHHWSPRQRAVGAMRPTVRSPCPTREPDGKRSGIDVTTSSRSRIPIRWEVPGSRRWTRPLWPRSTARWVASWTYSVVTPDAMLRRVPGEGDNLVDEQPWWTALIRIASGIEPHSRRPSGGMNQWQS